MTKAFRLLLFTGLISANATAQIVESMTDYRTNAEISMLELDSIYLNAVHGDSTQPAVFTGDAEEKWMDCWRNFNIDFGKFLTKNEFYWQENSRFFKKIYFSKEGKVEYFLYSSKSELFTTEIEDEFIVLAKDFINSYELKIDVPISRNFTQCGGARFSKTSKE